MKRGPRSIPFFLLYPWPRPSRPDDVGHLRVRVICRCQKPQASPPVGIVPSGSVMLVSDEAPEATCLSSLCGSFRRLVRRLFPLHASLWQGGDGRWDGCPNVDRARVRLWPSPPCGMSARAWPVAREVPAGWCTIPTGTLARGMGPWSFATSALIPAVSFAPLSGCSRQRWRLVCVPLRHVLPIRVSRLWGIRPHHPRQALRPEGDRCSGPGICACDSTPPRRRPRLA